MVDRGGDLLECVPDRIVRDRREVYDGVDICKDALGRVADVGEMLAVEQALG